MTQGRDVLLPLARSLGRLSPLSEAECAALLTLPFTLRRHDAPAYLVREGEPSRRFCGLVVSGLAFRHKLALNGARQIVSLHVPGDLLDLQGLYLTRMDYSVQALNLLETADIDSDALRDIMRRHPAVEHAMWACAFAEASIGREWLLNVGRRDARSRLAHLMCEMALRMRNAGLSDPQASVLPMTQEQLGDALGLTSVHINRTLKALADENAIGRDGRKIWIKNWDRLSAVAEFSTLYLHLADPAGIS